ncbi:FAD assembly factor SdhE [Anaplasma platys]|nr:succinate dehydrogenase assembly factor 2 [Anaplasma platys]
MSSASSVETRRRLFYRSAHRGCKEMDILLGAFAGNNLHLLRAEKLANYEVIVDLDDETLYSYIVGRVEVPDNIDRELIGLIADYARRK